MGRPFEEELNYLPLTYSWAIETEVEELARTLASGSHLPQLMVGSGGSFSAATFAAELHKTFNAQVAAAVTPLDFAGHSSVGQSSGSLFVSASGRNPDIVGALRSIAEIGGVWTSVICMQQESPLGQAARSFPQVELIEYQPPAGRDGFLATNSLLGMNTLLVRAYERFRGVHLDLPLDLAELLRPAQIWEEITLGAEDPFGPLWERATTILLHGSSSTATAVDLESKLTEAALASVHVSDYRNFAHGRHHWLAKRADESSILALITDGDREIAGRTLSLIPQNIPVVRLDIKENGPKADLALLVLGMYVTRSAGLRRNIDPGRPQVPAFGRRIYHLNAFSKRTPDRQTIARYETRAIERKSGRSVDFLRESGVLPDWRRAYHQFTQRLRSTEFQGLVLDYDGTLCDAHDRFSGIRPEVCAELVRVLSSGVSVGVATGRGKSVRADLRTKLPIELWGLVTIGYYNGAELGQLGDDAVPDPDQLPDSLLSRLAHVIEHTCTALDISITIRKHQLSAELNGLGSIVDIWETLNELVESSGAEGVRVLRSSHSVDILAPGVSKLSLVRYLGDLQAGDGTWQPSILCIGDRGRWPGNDFEMLSSTSALSVDEVSRLSGTCWNLAPEGSRGVTATIAYLRSLKLFTTGYFKVSVPVRPIGTARRQVKEHE